MAKKRTPEKKWESPHDSEEDAETTLDTSETALFRANTTTVTAPDVTYGAVEEGEEHDLIGHTPPNTDAEAVVHSTPTALLRAKQTTPSSPQPSGTGSYPTHFDTSETALFRANPKRVTAPDVTYSAVEEGEEHDLIGHTPPNTDAEAVVHSTPTALLRAKQTTPSSPQPSGTGSHPGSEVEEVVVPPRDQMVMTSRGVQCLAETRQPAKRPSSPTRKRPSKRCRICAKKVVNVPRHIRAVHGSGEARRYMLHAPKTVAQLQTEPGVKLRCFIRGCHKMVARLDRHLHRIHGIRVNTRESKRLQAKAKAELLKSSALGERPFRPEPTSRATATRRLFPETQKRPGTSPDAEPAPKRVRRPVIQDSSDEEEVPRAPAAATSAEAAGHSDPELTPDNESPSPSSPPDDTNQDADFSPPDSQSSSSEEVKRRSLPSVNQPGVAARKILQQYGRFMKSLDGGRLESATISAFKKQMGYVWGSVSPKYSLAALTTNKIRTKWLDPFDQRYKMAPGTTKSYLSAVIKFADFAIAESILPQEQCHQLRVAAANWRLSLRKASGKRRVKVALRDRESLITPETMRELEASPAAVEARGLLNRPDASLPQNFETVRDYVMLIANSETACRAGVLLNLTIGEFRSADRDVDGEGRSVYSMRVRKHKTGVHYPAPLVLSEETYGVMKQFLSDYRRPMDRAMGQGDSVFCEVDGSRLTNQSYAHHLRDRFPGFHFTSTLLRKSMRTQVGQERPEVRRKLAIAMSHTSKTGDQYYALDDRAKTAASVSGLMRDTMMGTQPTQDLSPFPIHPAQPYSTDDSDVAVIENISVRKLPRPNK